MLGAGSFTARTLLEFRNTDSGSFSYAPLILNYLPTSNSLIEIELPLIGYETTTGDAKQALADIKVVGKYQFFRKDGMGKTFRIAAKTIQTLPTGKALDLMYLSTGNYAGYYGIVAGIEKLNYGISNEIGYNWMPNGTLDEMRYKIGFGLPLLKPQYPNKQVNLYFEYTNSWLLERDWYQLLYAQGIQYARKNTTLDVSVQVPIINDVAEGRRLKYSLFGGGRFTF